MAGRWLALAAFRTPVFALAAFLLLPGASGCGRGGGATEPERDEYLIGDDLDGIFISPRDNQKYVVRYNLKPAPGGATRAVAWEATGQGGLRYVALSVGYVEEYDDETFRQYQK
jgi:hypothetical protein